MNMTTEQKPQQVIATNVEGVTIYLATVPVEVKNEIPLAQQPTSTFQTTGAKENIEKVIVNAEFALEQAKDTIVALSKSMVSAIRRVDHAITPDEFQLEFAISFGAEGQALVAKATAEAALKVTMIYRHTQPQSKEDK